MVVAVFPSLSLELSLNWMNKMGVSPRLKHKCVYGIGNQALWIWDACGRS